MYSVHRDLFKLRNLKICTLGLGRVFRYVYRIRKKIELMFNSESRNTACNIQNDALYILPLLTKLQFKMKVLKSYNYMSHDFHLSLKPKQGV